MIKESQLVKDLIFKSIKTGKYPYHLQVDIATICNLKCKMCCVPEVSCNYNNEIMSFETFKKTINTLQPQKVNFCTNGEPYLNPNLPKMLQYLSQKGIYSNLATNGTLVLKNQTPKELISSGLDFMRFSIDAANPSTYKKIRGADTFDTIVKNIKSIINDKLLYKAKKPHIRIEFIVQKDNVDEMVDILHLAHEVGVKHVHYRMLTTDFLGKDAKEAVSIKLSKEEMLKKCADVKKVARKYKIHTDISRYQKLYLARSIISDDARPVCILPWMNLFCDIDGNVMPCSIMIHNRDKKGIVGTVLKQNIDDLWNGSEIHKIREDFKAKRNYQTYYCCQNCSMYFSLRDIIEIASNLNFFSQRNI